MSKTSKLSHVRLLEIYGNTVFEYATCNPSSTEREDRLFYKCAELREELLKRIDKRRGKRTPR